MTDISDMRRREIYDRYHALVQSGMSRADALQGLSVEFSMDEETAAKLLAEFEPDPQPGD